MSTFVRQMYLPIMMDPHELTFEVWENIKRIVMDTYLHKETSGIMAINITVYKDKELPLGELINNQIMVQVPCNVVFKYYKMGDIVSGTLSITDENDVQVLCSDLTCVLARGAGTVSFSDSKYCFVKNGVVYPNGSTVTAVLKEARSSKNSNFEFLAALVDPPKEEDDELASSK
ncbi:RNA polymerase [Pteropox virus]|uniref:DNA-directed RNA polymerase 18 kDa subunit n=1 Tax=Pteropox virus TaxID=1873698 RepID=A0A1B1MRI7_9POXV|nr:RNA polymerase [Pteropox virus]ANS71172.1 RNA polymerase [Pteropox virus]